MLPVLYTVLGLKVNPQTEAAGLMVTSEFTLFATAISDPIVPTKLDVFPAGKGFNTFATTTVADASTVDPEKMLLSVI